MLEQCVKCGDVHECHRARHAVAEPVHLMSVIGRPECGDRGELPRLTANTAMVTCDECRDRRCEE